MINDTEPNIAWILVVLQQSSQLSDLAINFLQKSKLNVVVISFEEVDFINKLRQILSVRGEAYKTVLICSQAHLLEKNQIKLSLLFSEIELNPVNFGKLLLISSLSSHFEFVDYDYDEYQDLALRQTAFIGEFLRRFEESAVFLGQDLLDEQILDTFPLLLLLGLLERQQCPSFINKIAIQDAASFFGLFQEYLLKPHQAHRFLIVGKKTPFSEVSSKFANLYEQYFQKKLSPLPLITSELSPIFLATFSQVINTKTSFDFVLDKLARNAHVLIANRNGPVMKPAPIKNFGKTISNNVLIRVSKTSLNKTTLQPLRQPKSSLRASSLRFLGFLSKGRKAVSQQPNLTTDNLKVVESEILEVFANRRNEEKIDRRIKNVTIVRKIVNKSKKRRFLFFIGVTGLSISTIILILFASFKLSFYLLNKQLSSLFSDANFIDGLTDKSDFLSQKSTKIEKSIIKRISNFQLSFYSKFIGEDVLSDERDLDSLLALVLFSAKQDSLFLDQLYLLYQQIMTGNINISYSKQDLLSTLDKKTQFEKELNEVFNSQNFNLMESSQAQIWKTRSENNRLNFRSSLNSKLFLDASFDLLSKQQRFNLIFVDQDDNLARGGGGALKSFYVVSFFKDSLINKQKVGLDELRQINYGQKIPSQLTSKIFSENAGDLINLNHSVDFVDNAKEYVSLISQALNLRTDLLIGFHSNVNTQEIVASLDKINQLSQSELAKLLYLIVDGLDKKEFFAYSPDTTLQQFFDSNLWSGQQIKHQCPADFYQNNCLVDYFMQLQNDLSADSQPTYLQRIDHSIGIGEQLIRHRRQINFQIVGDVNNDNEWIQKTDYKALEFFMHSGAILERIDFNGRQLNSSDWLIVEDSNYLHLLLKLGFSRSKNNKLTLVYSLKNELVKPFAYTFLEQKQAGMADKSNTYGVVFSDNLQPKLIAPRALYQEKAIQFKTKNQDHFFFAVNFE